MVEKGKKRLNEGFVPPKVPKTPNEEQTGFVPPSLPKKPPKKTTKGK